MEDLDKIICEGIFVEKAKELLEKRLEASIEVLEWDTCFSKSIITLTYNYEYLPS